MQAGDQRGRTLHKARSSHRRFLFRQITRRLQASVEAPLSEEVRQFAPALASNSALDRRIATNVRRRRAVLPIDFAVRIKLLPDRDSRLLL